MRLMASQMAIKGLLLHSFHSVTYSLDMVLKKGSGPYYGKKL